MWLSQSVDTELDDHDSAEVSRLVDEARWSSMKAQRKVVFSVMGGNISDINADSFESRYSQSCIILALVENKNRNWLLLYSGTNFEMKAESIVQ